MVKHVTDKRNNAIDILDGILNQLEKSTDYQISEDNINGKLLALLKIY